MLRYLLIVFQNLFDIFKIYLKFAFIMLAIYVAAEWYILRFDIDLNDNEASLVPAKTASAAAAATDNSTAYKIYRFMLDFFFR